MAGRRIKHLSLSLGDRILFFHSHIFQTLSIFVLIMEKSLLLSFFIFSWRMVALQCCVGFCRTTACISCKGACLPLPLERPPWCLQRAELPVCSPPLALHRTCVSVLLSLRPTSPSPAVSTDPVSDSAMRSLSDFYENAWVAAAAPWCPGAFLGCFCHLVLSATHCSDQRRDKALRQVGISLAVHFPHGGGWGGNISDTWKVHCVCVRDFFKVLSTVY